MILQMAPLLYFENQCHLVNKQYIVDLPVIIFYSKYCFNYAEYIVVLLLLENGVLTIINLNHFM